METYGWGASASIEQHLFAQPQDFDFFQAVILLEKLFPESTKAAQGLNPKQEAVRFVGEISMKFPADEIAFLRRHADYAQAVMGVNFMNIAGALAPLPRPYTEFILERLRNKDSSSKDFLDIFLHRLVSLFVRAYRTRHPALDPAVSPAEGQMADYVLAILGGKQAPEREILGHSLLLEQNALLRSSVKTPAGLEQLLTGIFHCRCVVVPFVGGWYRNKAEQCTYLGSKNSSLGSALLGMRIWDQHATISIELYDSPLRFMPLSPEFPLLLQLVNVYCRDVYDVEIVVIPTALPKVALSSTQENSIALGWNSYCIGNNEKKQPDCKPLHLRPRIIAESLKKVASLPDVLQVVQAVVTQQIEE